MYKITVVGIGYVGLSNAILLAQRNHVTAYDIDSDKVDKLNQKISPIVDEEISNFLSTKHLNLQATSDKKNAYQDADLIIFATPTDYNPETNYFDTSSIENAIYDVIQINPKAILVIKSTVPVGFTDEMKQKYALKHIIFSPEFLREGSALQDNLHPSRIVAGGDSKDVSIFADLMINGAIKKDIDVLLTNSAEAEAIKLFSNTYLAMRVAFFNELDSYAEQYNLDSKQIIQGIGLDPRIGSHYNNPSFGYGGYCLPKDTMQLKANFKDTPNNIIGAIVDANTTRKKFIVNSILKKNPKKIGIYRLLMKSGSDNFRSAPIFDIIDLIKEKDKSIEIYIYEPLLKKENLIDTKVIRNFDEFANAVDLIVANRNSSEICSYRSKVYSRDLFGND